MLRKSIRAAAAWAILILILCGIPGSNFPKLTFLEWLKPDKIVHLILFGTQSYLLMSAFTRQFQYPNLKTHAGRYAVLISIAYGGLVEVLQSTIFIGRTGDIRDAVANAIGALLGLYIYRRINRRQIS